MARLFTVVIVESVLHIPGTDSTLTVFEADFAGIHFSRQRALDVTYWVRVAARNRYGKQTQVIFVYAQKGIDQ